MKVIEDYLILYRIDERGPLILRVVHGAMDISRIEIVVREIFGGWLD